MITAHVMGLPIEESVLQFVPAGAAMAAAAGIAVRTAFDRIRRFRRNSIRRGVGEGGS